MDDKILAIAPYNYELLRAIADFQKVVNYYIVLLGNKKKITNECLIHNIEFENMKIIEESSDVDICIRAKELISNGHYHYVIFGSIFPGYYYRILDKASADEISTINVIDIPDLKNYMFVSSGSKSKFPDFSDRKEAIFKANRMMKGLSVVQTKAAIITNSIKKADIQEVDLIKMLVRDEDYDNILLFDYHNLTDIFSDESKTNVFKSEINLIQMKDYDCHKVFVDTLSLFIKCKVAHFVVTDKTLIVDSYGAKSYDNILFSLYLMDKLIEENVYDNLFYDIII